MKNKTYKLTHFINFQPHGWKELNAVAITKRSKFDVEVGSIKMEKWKWMNIGGCSRVSCKAAKLYQTDVVPIRTSFWWYIFFFGVETIQMKLQRTKTSVTWRLSRTMLQKAYYWKLVSDTMEKHIGCLL